ncbi:MAG: phosphate ABC transporter permease PstA [Gemmatimonadota bacterium]|uniref:phosphate ABC transporter permease PstA n=1 Tax=Candidatus Palauibacter scopulicola TaxID=3056741 RepID=UPI00239D416E|nr:phosphate ABC transporter permease PstA [Candidatus Palauibacter scopulicola]MDE2661965.1 phosphate ABC transporter permease PstA [Candidatus Palauibacter scopulicola]
MNPGAAPPRSGRFEPRVAARRRAGVRFKWLCRFAVAFAVASLLVLLVHILATGLPTLSPDFLVTFPSRFPDRAGIRSAILGSLWLLTLVAAMSFPLGVGAAVYLEEYAPRNRLTNLLQTNIANLAGVPSIVYGLLGLAVFVRFLSLERSLLAGAATLSLLVLPLVIVAAREAIRAVPDSLREAAYALGATRWQAIRHHVLPAALPGILSGTILALSRAGGETAPLLIIGALTFIAFDPVSVMDPFTVLPIQIFNWTADPREEFHALAAGAIVVLLGVLLLMNAAAILIRNRYER